MESIETAAAKIPADAHPPSPLKGELDALVRRLAMRYGGRPLRNVVLAPILGFNSAAALGGHLLEAPGKPYDCGAKSEPHRKRLRLMAEVLDDARATPAGVTWRSAKADAPAWLAWWQQLGLVVARRRRDHTGDDAAPAQAELPAVAPSNITPLRPVSLGAAADRAATTEAGDIHGDYRRKFLAGQAQGNRLAKETLDALEAGADDRNAIRGSLARIEELLGRLLAVWEPRS